MTSKTYRERVEVLKPPHDEASWWPDRTQPGPGDLRTDDEHLAFIDGYKAAQRDAAVVVAEADEEIARLCAALVACRTAAETLRVRHEGEAEDFRASVVDAPNDEEAGRRRTSAEQHWCAEDACSEIVKFIDDKMTSLGVEMPESTT